MRGTGGTASTGTASTGTETERGKETGSPGTIGDDLIAMTGTDDSQKGTAIVVPMIADLMVRVSVTLLHRTLLSNILTSF